MLAKRSDCRRPVLDAAAQAGKGGASSPATTPGWPSARVSPHSIRHTTATHLLRAGVDINTVRGWLGYVSLDTTNVYAEVDFETKLRRSKNARRRASARSQNDGVINRG